MDRYCQRDPHAEESQPVKKLNEGQRVLVMVWVVVLASVAAGSITIGLVGWSLFGVRVERSQLKERQQQLVRDNEQIDRLVEAVLSEFDELLDERTVHTPNPTPINELQTLVDTRLHSDPEGHLRLILNGLQASSSKMKEFWNQTVVWNAQYKMIFPDLSEHRTLRHVRNLVNNLEEAVVTAEGRSRIDDAILYKRWRASRGAEASRLAQVILEQRAQRETKDLRTFEIELSEVGRLIEVLAGEEEIDNLADIKDNQLKASLGRLRRDFKGLIDIDESFAQVDPQILEAIYVALFGKEYSIDTSHQTVIVGQGGLYQLQHTLLRLRQQKDELQVKVKHVSTEINSFQDRFALLTQQYATTLARDVEENLTQSLYNLLIIGGACFIGFLGLAVMISRSIRRQVNTIEEARAAEQASNQTTQCLLEEQKRSAEAIAKLHRDNQLILDSAGEGIYGIDLNGNATFVNPAGAKMLGYDVEELVGKPTHATVHHTRADGSPYPKDECPMYDAFKDGAVHQVDTDVLWRKDGTSFPVAYTSTPIWEGGQVAGVVVTFQDITERKQAEREMHKARVAAETANKAKSDFLASMSHELRTPLNGILGYAQILKRDPHLLEKQKAGVDVIQRCGDHLLTLINDILDLSKIEAQKLELQPTEFQLPDCLQQIANMVRVRADQSGLAFVHETAGNLPQMVRGDEKRLRQILLNLLSNAIKFTEKGEVAFRVAYDKESEVQGTLSVQVQDTGRGIPADKLKEIFLPFQQVGEHSQQEAGTGLGLAITRKLVTLMNGTLEVTSTVGEGSSFVVKVSLPPVQDWTPEPRKPDQTIIGYHGNRKRILVVDDKWENRIILVNLLDPLGFEVNQASNGSEGLAKAEEQRPDLIVMDLVMPGMDGLEATRRIRASAELKDIPIIASSASAFEFNRYDAISAGCTAFLAKPVRAEELFEHLRVHLKLEWRYDSDTIGKVSVQKTDEPLVPPPQEELTALLELAKVGKIMAIRQQIGGMEHLGHQYAPFIQELRNIVKGFDMDQLVKFLARYVEDPK